MGGVLACALTPCSGTYSPLAGVLFRGTSSPYPPERAWSFQQCACLVGGAGNSRIARCHLGRIHVSDDASRSCPLVIATSPASPSCRPWEPFAGLFCQGWRQAFVSPSNANPMLRASLHSGAPAWRRRFKHHWPMCRITRGYWINQHPPRFYYLS